MSVEELDTKIVNGYLELLKNLSPVAKKDLITKLTRLTKFDQATQKDGLEASFGAWHGDEEAEDIIKIIRKSRTTNRNIESF